MKPKAVRRFGTALRLRAAGFLSLASRIRDLVPFAFVAVILFAAMRFGTGAAIQGTLGAAVVSGELSFEPRFSLCIRDIRTRQPGMG